MKQFRMLVIGLIAGVMLTISATAFAAGGISKIEAYLREGFTFKVNGQVATLENTPIVYNDTSYMPVRELAGMLGYDVGFEDNTITLDAKQPQATPAATEQVKDVNDVTTSEITEVDTWVTLDYAEQQGVIFLNDGDVLEFTYGSITGKIRIPDSDGVAVISGGYSIKKEGDTVYFSRDSLETLLSQ